MWNQGLGEALRETPPGWLVTQMSPHLAVVTVLGWEVNSTFTLGSYGGFQPCRSQVTSTVPSLVAFKVNHDFRGVSRMIDEPKKWKMKSQRMISWIHQAEFWIFFFNSNDFMENLCWLERIMNKLRDKFWVIHRSFFFQIWRERWLPWRYLTRGRCWLYCDWHMRVDSSGWSCSGHTHTGLVAFAEEE